MWVERVEVGRVGKLLGSYFYGVDEKNFLSHKERLHRIIVCIS